jgi:hypothetical protein
MCQNLQIIAHRQNNTNHYTQCTPQKGHDAVEVGEHDCDEHWDSNTPDANHRAEYAVCRIRDDTTGGQQPEKDIQCGTYRASVQRHFGNGDDCRSRKDEVIQYDGISLRPKYTSRDLASTQTLGGGYFFQDGLPEHEISCDAHSDIDCEGHGVTHPERLGEFIRMAHVTEDWRKACVRGGYLVGKWSGRPRGP